MSNDLNWPTDGVRFVSHDSPHRLIRYPIYDGLILWRLFPIRDDPTESLGDAAARVISLGDWVCKAFQTEHRASPFRYDAHSLAAEALRVTIFPYPDT
ncbi:hypothetical protein FB601_10676 [Burkholderia sp. SJZ091]|nr:hypothetical protein FB601_10676 [Burkholderia sp. SJZ091]